MANENFCKAYSLKSIRYPTGGTRVFRYQMQGEMQFVPYGGLRIHKVVSYSSQNDSTVCEYQYSGSYATEPPTFPDVANEIKLRIQTIQIYSGNIFMIYLPFPFLI